MNLIKKLFTKLTSALSQPAVMRSHFSVEFYPLTDRYYPKYKSFYLKTNYMTGIVEAMEPYLFMYAEYGKTEAEAEKIIERFKEHYLKENVVRIEK